MGFALYLITVRNVHAINYLSIHTTSVIVFMTKPNNAANCSCEIFQLFVSVYLAFFVDESNIFEIVDCQFSSPLKN